MKLISGVRKSRNVVGIIPGSDLAKEYVVIGAHMDHLGAVKGKSGKLDIYNGADDNASGVAGLIEVARAFSKEMDGPRRTIVFIAFGSEEIGVLGSNYYVNNPLFPLDKIHIMINLDMDSSRLIRKFEDLLCDQTFPYPAQRDRSNAQIGCNMILWNVIFKSGI